MKRGMIHGRFQPFHLGHLEYLQGAAAQSDEVWVGITNPDPTRVKPEAIKDIVVEKTFIAGRAVFERR